MVMHTASNELCGCKIFQWLQWRCNICDAYFPFFVREQIQVTRKQGLGWVSTLVGFLKIRWNQGSCIGRRWNPPSSRQWHMGAYYQPVQASWALPNYIFQPNQGRFLFCTHIRASYSAGKWILLHHQPNLLCYEGFQLLLWPHWIFFVEQLPPIWAIIIISACTIEQWEIKNKYSILWNRKPKHPHFRSFKKVW